MKPKVVAICLLFAILISSVFVRSSTRAQENASRALTMEQASEEEAYAISLEAYLYGYPRVELARRMHNETNRVSPDQTIFAPPNQFHYFGRLAGPGDGKALKAANNDTLYASAYLDLTKEPIILRVPKMGNRLYVGLLVDARGSVFKRLSTMATGSGGVDYAFIGPGKDGSLPEGVKPIPVAGNDLWLLMRVATLGSPEDQLQANELLKQFRLAPLSNPSQLATAQASKTVADQKLTSEPLTPFGNLQFFHVMASMLDRNPVPDSDQGLQDRWERIGLRPGRFDESGIKPSVKRGMERAIIQAEKLVVAAQFGIAITKNGWNYSLKVGRTSNDWALNAAIARGGYGNLPEDSVYYQRTLDSNDQPLSGKQPFKMTFPSGMLPPVGAFWSITAYEIESMDFIKNPIERYSIGDRTPGLVKNPDGSLTIFIQQEPPKEPNEQANWLPVGQSPFYLIIRTYDPGTEILDGTWAPPQVVPR